MHNNRFIADIILCFPSIAIFSNREVTFTLAICYRPSVCLSSVGLSSVTFAHPTQAIDIFGNVSTPFGTLPICDLSIKILRRSSQRNPSVVSRPYSTQQFLSSGKCRILFIYLISSRLNIMRQFNVVSQ